MCYILLEVACVGESIKIMKTLPFEEGDGAYLIRDDHSIEIVNNDFNVNVVIFVDKNKKLVKLPDVEVYCNGREGVFAISSKGERCELDQKTTFLDEKIRINVKPGSTFIDYLEEGKKIEVKNDPELGAFVIILDLIADSCAYISRSGQSILVANEDILEMKRKDSPTLIDRIYSALMGLI